MNASEPCILITHLLTKAWKNICKDTCALWKYFEQTGCLVTAIGEENDKISPQKFKESGGYKFNESCGYFGHPDYENSNTDQGENRVEYNVPRK